VGDEDERLHAWPKGHVGVMAIGAADLAPSEDGLNPAADD